MTANAWFDDYTLSVDDSETDFYIDLDYFEPENGVTVKSEMDQMIVYEICGIQFCKDLSSGEYQLYADHRAD